MAFFAENQENKKKILLFCFFLKRKKKASEAERKNKKNAPAVLVAQSTSLYTVRRQVSPPTVFPLAVGDCFLPATRAVFLPPFSFRIAENGI